MSEIIYKGLRLVTSQCKYFQVVEGENESLLEDQSSSTLKLTYTTSSTPLSLSKSLGIELVGPGDLLLESMPLPKKISKVFVSLNGLKLEKLTYDSHVLHIIIAEDTESRVVQDYSQTTIVVSKDDYKNPEFIKFLFFSGRLIYFRPIGSLPDCYVIKNFPRILIKDTSRDLISNSEAIFNLRRSYNDYLIRSIDYQDQFISELRRILDRYGIDLVRFNKETTLSRTSYITYQFVQTPNKYGHTGCSDDSRKILRHRQPVEFNLRTTDMVLYFDFKNKYSNVDLLTNFCEFKTADKYGKLWSCAIKWSQVTEDFNHTYQPDDNSNFSNQCQFRCELYYYEVIDDRYNFLEEIISNLELIN